MPLPPLVSSNLPSATGPYNVGYIPLSHKPISPFSHPQPLFTETTTPALRVHDIGYSVFYPADSKKGPKGVSWVPQPFWGVVKGYELFLQGKTGQASSRGMRWLASTLGYIAGRLRIPVHPYAPLLPPTASSGKYPLVIFSHGLAGTRHTYSQFCAGLASEGYVVLALEHKDGSGPAVCLSAEEGNGDGKVLHYIRQGDIKWASGEDKSLTHFRTLQLDIRSREIYESYHTFKNLITNNSLEGNNAYNLLSEVGDNKEKEKDVEKKKAWIDNLKEKVDFEDLKLTGHSFGGGTVLHILQTPSPDPTNLPPLPIKHAIALDPWLEPIPLPSSSTKSHPAMPPILVINSIGFTEWSNHFKRLVGMIKSAQGSLVSIVGVGHQSFSDFPLLDPRSHNSAKLLLNKIHDLSTAFLQGKLNEMVDIKDKKADNGELVKNENGKLGDKEGEVIVHLIGKE
ncbi:hypothetical protein I302_107429 [Kwoniella bestiolae CBS 10118]|uniref:Putative phospholipase n=1 Tax=Kwoniella bestiolae CBS 10118 TaxID=1296100 RepID=A0A1B9FYJ9_9TREE|nr:hypothetical protein I302_06830 [Kwoniella bestiolae CBS 10118]OCF23846.1 hypothetical protein I302_06830 [Kwoniella bestiolae CBS 10118]